MMFFMDRLHTELTDERGGALGSEGSRDFIDGDHATRSGDGASGKFRTTLSPSS